MIDYPPAQNVNAAFKPAPKVKKAKGSKQLSLEEARGEAWCGKMRSSPFVNI